MVSNDGNVSLIDVENGECRVGQKLLGRPCQMNEGRWKIGKSLPHSSAIIRESSSTIRRSYTRSWFDTWTNWFCTQTTDARKRPRPAVTNRRTLCVTLESANVTVNDVLGQKALLIWGKGGLFSSALFVPNCTFGKPEVGEWIRMCFKLTMVNAIHVVDVPPEPDISTQVKLTCRRRFRFPDF